MMIHQQEYDGYLDEPVTDGWFPRCDNCRTRLDLRNNPWQADLEALQRGWITTADGHMLCDTCTKTAGAA